MLPLRLQSGRPSSSFTVTFEVLLFGLLSTALLATAVGAQPETTLDLLDVQDGDGILQRIFGYDGSGQYGVPLAAGHDVDGDGIADSAFALMTASPNGDFSGEVDLIFGTGVLDGSLDTAITAPSFLRIFGADAYEVAGSEVWMDDVTGDGVGDLLICRQNFDFSGRVGAGALTILPGGAHVRTYAATLQPLQLTATPAQFRETTLVGRASGDRLCIWVRTGDVDDDGTADIVVGADQEAGGAFSHRGAVWVVRGGDHLDDAGVVDLSDFSPGISSPAALDGDLAHVLPPGAHHLHAGGTCNIADLDGDGRGEVLFAAALNRAGASLPPSAPVGTHGSGGTTDGTVYIAWAENLFPDTAWASGYELTVPSTPDADYTVLHGEAANMRFGEELFGGADFDGDGDLDLFVGDLQGSPPLRSQAGLGHVIFDAFLLRGQVGVVDAFPGGIGVSRIYGPEAGAIGADTAAVGDFDDDGHGDLLFASPHASPNARLRAGQVHLLFGQAGAWPAVVDLAAPPAPGVLRVAQIDGKKADDVLGYSAAAGDLNGDGRVDLAINEMKGDGPSVTDAGNLLLIAGRTFDPAYVFDDGFESGDTSYWSSSVP